jgi:hypothetical protein
MLRYKLDIDSIGRVRVKNTFKLKKKVKKYIKGVEKVIICIK